MDTGDIKSKRKYKFTDSLLDSINIDHIFSSSSRNRPAALFLYKIANTYRKNFQVYLKITISCLSVLNTTDDNLKL